MGFCNHDDCRERARWHPVIKVWPEVRQLNTPPARAVLSLQLCDTHMDQLKLNELLDGEGWARIANGFSFRNKMEPSRSSAKLDRKRIIDA